MPPWNVISFVRGDLFWHHFFAVLTRLTPRAIRLLPTALQRSQVKGTALAIPLITGEPDQKPRRDSGLCIGGCLKLMPEFLAAIVAASVVTLIAANLVQMCEN